MGVRHMGTEGQWPAGVGCPLCYEEWDFHINSRPAIAHSMKSSLPSFPRRACCSSPPKHRPGCHSDSWDLLRSVPHPMQRQKDVPRPSSPHSSVPWCSLLPPKLSAWELFPLTSQEAYGCGLTSQLVTVKGTHTPRSPTPDTCPSAHTERAQLSA